MNPLYHFSFAAFRLFAGWCIILWEREMAERLHYTMAWCFFPFCILLSIDRYQNPPFHFLAIAFNESTQWHILEFHILTYNSCIIALKYAHRREKHIRKPKEFTMKFMKTEINTSHARNVFNKGRMRWAEESTKRAKNEMSWTEQRTLLSAKAQVSRHFRSFDSPLDVLKDQNVRVP